MPRNHAALTRNARLPRAGVSNAFAQSEKLEEYVIKVGYQVTIVSEVLQVFKECESGRGVGVILSTMFMQGESCVSMLCHQSSQHLHSFFK